MVHAVILAALKQDSGHEKPGRTVFSFSLRFRILAETGVLERGICYFRGEKAMPAR